VSFVSAAQEAHAYLALFRAGCRRSQRYKLALVSGLLTNLFFGLVRTALFYALYREGADVAVRGLDLADALTYVWMVQAMFGVVWASWIWEFPEAVRSGDFVVELTRPGDPWLRQLAYELGRTLNQLLLRSTLPLLGAAALLPLALPTTPVGVLLVAVSMVLASVVAFEVRFLFGTVAFWSSDYRAVFNIVFPVLWLVSGFVIPIDYFPAALRALAEGSPLYAMLMAPVHVAVGQSVAGSLARQVAWVVALGAASRVALSLACRRLVVHGG